MESGRLRPLVVMARRIGRHELIDRGAALTYYSVLSLIPGVLVLFSVIGLFGDQDTIDEVLGIIDAVGPSDGDAAAREPLEQLVRDDTRSGALLGVGLIAILWTASAYVGSFFRASATIWGVETQSRLAGMAAAHGVHRGGPDPARVRPVSDRADGGAREVDRGRARDRRHDARHLRRRQVAGAARDRGRAGRPALPGVPQRRAHRDEMAGTDTPEEVQR